MASSVQFAAFFVYSPRGSSEVSVKSRQIRDHIKAGRSEFLRKAAARLAADVEEGALKGFFDPSAVLIPAPRSSPLVEGALWPGERIAKALVRVGLGADVQAILRRTASVPKAAYARPGERPTAQRHRETIAVEPMLGDPTKFIVVDDVVTKGEMLYACVSLLRERFPDADISAFALLRTMGLVPDVEAFIDPCMGTIRLNQWGGLDRNP